MIKEVVLLDTGSIGGSTLKIISKRKFKVTLLSANNNIHKLFKQSINLKLNMPLYVIMKNIINLNLSLKKKKNYILVSNIDKIIKKSFLLY